MDRNFPHRLWSKGFVLFVVAVAFFSLIGWSFDIEIFKRILPNSVAMNPMSAICFILSAISFLLLTSKKRRRIELVAGKILAIIVLLVGTQVFLGYVFGYKSNIDKLFFSAKLQNEMGGHLSNMMAPNTAFCFILTSIGLLLLNFETRKKTMPTQFLALILALGALLAELGYLYGLGVLYTLPTFIPMAFHTAFNFFLMSLALLFVHPQKGLMATLTTPNTGGVVFRTFIIPSVVFPMLLGYVYEYAMTNALVSHSLANIFLVYSIIIGFIFINYFLAQVLNYKEALRKKVEENLAESNKKFKNFFDFAPFPMWVYDIETLRFLEVNSTAITKYGYTLEEFKSMGIGDIRPEEDVPKLLRSVKERNEGNETNDSNWRHRLKDGKIIDVLITTQLFVNEGRDACLVIAKDITERLKAEEQIKTLNKDLEAFTFSVAHDLRAPLRIIDGYSGVLREDYSAALDGEGNRLLNIISTNAQQMGQLIDDLLNLSRVGRASLNCTHVDMLYLAGKCVEEQLVFDAERKVTINMSNLEPAYCDGVLMKSVFNNLISNAIKYSHRKEAPIIEIGSYQKDGELVYFVKDNGVGFDMKHADKLFGVFQRLHKVTDFKGTGVGLAIVQRIISKHGGRVWVNAVKEEGATFYFSLPYNNHN